MIPQPPISTLFPYTTLFRSLLVPLHPIPDPPPRMPVRRPAATLIPGTTRHYQPRKNRLDRKSTRLNSSHVRISYAVFCLKKKNNKELIYNTLMKEHITTVSA